MTTQHHDSFAMGPDALMAAITNNTDYSLVNPVLMAPQDGLACMFQMPLAAPTDTKLMSSMIDDWLADELQNSGVLAQADLDASALPLGDAANLFLQSPPLAATPAQDGDSVSSGVSEASAKSPLELFTPQATAPSVPLFPDIQTWVQPKSPKAAMPVTVPAPTPRPIAAAPAQRPLRPVPIMPKTESPVVGYGMPNIAPTTGKRKAMSDKEQDEIDLKRQRNTDAARRSRLKKLIKMENLEKRVAELEGDNTRLTTRIAVLESEKSGLESKDKDLQERIRVLEDQLAAAHKALTAKCSHN